MSTDDPTSTFPSKRLLVPTSLRLPFMSGTRPGSPRLAGLLSQRQPNEDQDQGQSQEARDFFARGPADESYPSLSPSDVYEVSSKCRSQTPGISTSPEAVLGMRPCSLSCKTEVMRSSPTSPTPTHFGSGVKVRRLDFSTPSPPAANLSVLMAAESEFTRLHPPTSELGAEVGKGAREKPEDSGFFLLRNSPMQVFNSFSPDWEQQPYLSQTVCHPADSKDWLAKKKRVCCSCKRSQCVKLYCECFLKQSYCGEDCKCNNCLNTSAHVEDRKRAVASTLVRNPKAFVPRVVPLQEVAESRHTKGCNCKRSGCRKGYCECFQNRARCTPLCKCSQCMNRGETVEKRPRKRRLVL